MLASKHVRAMYRYICTVHLNAQHRSRSANGAVVWSSTVDEDSNYRYGILHTPRRWREVLRHMVIRINNNNNNNNNNHNNTQRQLLVSTKRKTPDR